MSLALKKFLVNVLVLGKNLREYSRTLVTRNSEGKRKMVQVSGEFKLSG